MAEQAEESERVLTAPGAGGFWSAQKIRQRHLDDGIFSEVDPGDDASPFEPIALREAQLNAASYNLRMGSEVYISPVADTDWKTIHPLREEEGFVIPPGQFAFLLTREIVRIPENAIALVALRAVAVKFQGLVNVSGFHVDPGYYGRLVFAVYNAGPGRVHLREGQELFEIFFADLEGETAKPYRKTGLFRIRPDLVSRIAGEFGTIEGLKNKVEDVHDELDKRIHALEREQSVVRWASALILGALVAFGLRYCAPAASAAQMSVQQISAEQVRGAVDDGR